MPVLYDKVEIGTDPNNIDVEYIKANQNLSCNLATDLMENINLIDYDHEDFLSLSEFKQNELKSKYSEIKLTPYFQRIRRLIVIGVPHGGTTWFQKLLNKHKYIQMSGELLFDWSTTRCNAHYMSNDNTLCNWNTMKSIMETYFIKSTINRYNVLYKQNIKNVYYNGFKITLWQLMPTMYGEFIRWIYCNDVTVIQLVRSATINAFWSEQAQSFEFIFYGHSFDKNKIIKKKSKNRDNNDDLIVKDEGFKLDPYKTQKYIENTEFWINILKNLLRYHKKSISFIQLFYEDLIGKYGINYLNSLQIFLNVKYDDDVFVDSSVTKRLHPVPCYAKILNWNDEIKPAIVGTDSYYACQKEKT